MDELQTLIQDGLAVEENRITIINPGVDNGGTSSKIGGSFIIKHWLNAAEVTSSVR